LARWKGERRADAGGDINESLEALGRGDMVGRAVVIFD
jgi:hypothetical protein